MTINDVIHSAIFPPPHKTEVPVTGRRMMLLNPFAIAVPAVRKSIDPGSVGQLRGFFRISINSGHMFISEYMLAIIDNRDRLWE